jgi:rubrerythrin
MQEYFCMKCGHTWKTEAEEVQCPECGSLNVHTDDTEVEEDGEEDED